MLVRSPIPPQKRRKDQHEDREPPGSSRSPRALGKTMGKRTIAELVENDAIRAALRTIGVDFEREQESPVPA